MQRSNVMSHSLYTFGGQEAHALTLQRRFMRYMKGLPGPIADIGCGRGMFLAELKAAGYEAVGVDASDESVAACKAKGLDIVQADALEYLENRPDQLGGVFLSHVVEHLTPEQVVRFLRVARRALRPGGRLIMVTPNVTDLWTMTEVFWLDTTHVRPYPILLLKSLCEEAGLRPVASGSHGLGWRAMGRRRIPQYHWRRLIWGSEYGRTDAYVVAQAE